MSKRTIRYAAVEGENDQSARSPIHRVEIALSRAHAFISYVRDNSDIVDRLAEDLRASGVKVWLDRDDIMPGQYWKDAIEEAIQNGAYFIACFSKQFNERQETYMHGELRIAIDRLRNMPRSRVWFIPVLLNDSDIPSHRISDHETLKDINVVRLFEYWDTGLKSIMRSMRLDDPDHRRVLHLLELIKYYPEERLYAMEQLGGTSEATSEAVPALIDVLRDADETVRDGAADALKKFGPAAVAALIEALRDANKELRDGAADALKKFGPEAVPALIEALRDADKNVRTRVASALGNIRTAAVVALIDALRDADANVRDGAADALGNMPWEARETAPALIEALRDANSDVRSSAVWALQRIGTFADPEIREALRNADSYTRWGAAVALGPYSRIAVPVLMEALRDGDSDWRRRAASHLGWFRPAASEAVPLLVEALRDPDSEVRRSAAFALGSIGPGASEAIPALIEALRDPDSEVRRSAVEALVSFDPTAAGETVPALIEALRDADGDVRLSIEEALQTIRSGTP